ncbi:restriction endonuclease subunit S [Candidatus Accumulibacter contiguus]
MKDSGFDAIGRFPEDWSVYRLKDVLRQAAKAHTNLATQYVGLEHITGWTGKAVPIDLEIAGYQSAQPIRQGTICFSKLRPYLAKALLAPADLIGTSELLVARALRSVHPEYVLYWLLSHRFINAINDTVVGTKMPRVDWPIFAGMPVPLPKVDEQRRIAAWLDIQTSRIDKRRELLGKKRELLRYLRQTLLDEVISNGLTKSRSVQTGQPALPKLPVHWSLSKFKSQVFFREGPGIMATDFMQAGVPLLRIGNITPGLITMEGCNYVAPEKAERQWRQFRLKLGDIVISASASTGMVRNVSKTICES